MHLPHTAPVVSEDNFQSLFSLSTIGAGHQAGAMGLYDTHRAISPAPEIRIKTLISCVSWAAFAQLWNLLLVGSVGMRTEGMLPPVLSYS